MRDLFIRFCVWCIRKDAIRNNYNPRDYFTDPWGFA
jgi:hypothetical protein